MSDNKELNVLKKVLVLLNEGYHEIEVVDHMGDDVFEYLNLLERYYIHVKRYEDDTIVANAKDEAEDDPEYVKEVLSQIKPGDEEKLKVFIEHRIKLLNQNV